MIKILKVGAYTKELEADELPHCTGTRNTLNVESKLCCELRGTQYFEQCPDGIRTLSHRCLWERRDAVA